MNEQQPKNQDRRAIAFICIAAGLSEECREYLEDLFRGRSEASAISYIEIGYWLGYFQSLIVKVDIGNRTQYLAEVQFLRSYFMPLPVRDRIAAKENSRNHVGAVA